MKAYAQGIGQGFGIITGDIPGCDFATGKLTAGCIPAFIGHVIVLLFYVTGTIFLLSIIWSGFQIALSPLTGSDSSAGKERITWSIIGFAVCALVVVIINVILSNLT